MVHLPNKALILLLVGSICVFSSATSASNTRTAVIELFTSQGCYSCPPADALLEDLIHADRGIIGLEFHVDYWDELTYGRAGKWKDPFSNPRYSDRQRKYDRRRLSGQRGVYTPQVVVNGRFVMVGTNRGAIESALNAVAQSRAPKISLRSKFDREITVSLDGDVKQSAAIWLLIFDRKRTTSVSHGENHGKTLTNHNIVREIRHIGDWRGRPTVISIVDLTLADDQGCAILVQSEDQGPILGATLC